MYAFTHMPFHALHTAGSRLRFFPSLVPARSLYIRACGSFTHARTGSAWFFGRVRSPRGLVRAYFMPRFALHGLHFVAFSTPRGHLTSGLPAHSTRLRFKLALFHSHFTAFTVRYILPVLYYTLPLVSPVAVHYVRCPTTSFWFTHTFTTYAPGFSWFSLFHGSCRTRLRGLPVLLPFCGSHCGLPRTFFHHRTRLPGLPGSYILPRAVTHFTGSHSVYSPTHAHYTHARFCAHTFCSREHYTRTLQRRGCYRCAPPRSRCTSFTVRLSYTVYASRAPDSWFTSGYARLAFLPHCTALRHRGSFA